MTTLLSSQLLRASTINPSNSAGTMISPRAAPGFLAPRRALRAVSAEGNPVCGKRTCTTLGKGSVPRRKQVGGAVFIEGLLLRQEYEATS
jgi:hypothetical protein